MLDEMEHGTSYAREVRASLDLLQTFGNRQHLASATSSRPYSFYVSVALRAAHQWEICLSALR